MNREKYLKDRQELQNKAQNFLNENKIDEANAVMAEIKALDEKFEEASKAQANLNAMGEPSQTSFSNAMVNGENNSFSNAIEPVDSVGDMYNSTEYRTNFMNHVLSGAPISTKFKNANATTKTSDVGTVIPTTIVQKIIRKITESGSLLAEVTQTSFKGGVSIPTASVKPVATWVAEGASSDTQKITTNEITFKYYKLRCAISMTLETSIVTLDFFETEFVNMVSEAMVTALETSILTGTGTGQPKGILKETVVTGQNVDVALAKTLDYKTLCALMGKVPSGYSSKVKWGMSFATFWAVQGMTDSSNQPIGRVNYGIDGEPKAMLLGRPVVFHDSIPSYTDTPTADIVPLFLFNFKDYALNKNMDITVKRYEDNLTDDQVTKAIMLVDGKVTDSNSLVTLTKKST